MLHDLKYNSLIFVLFYISQYQDYLYISVDIPIRLISSTKDAFLYKEYTLSLTKSSWGMSYDANVVFLSMRAHVCILVVTECGGITVDNNNKWKESITDIPFLP